jgi:putative serine protease PepD
MTDSWTTDRPSGPPTRTEAPPWAAPAGRPAEAPGTGSGSGSGAAGRPAEVSPRPLGPPLGAPGTYSWGSGPPSTPPRPVPTGPTRPRRSWGRGLLVALLAVVVLGGSGYLVRGLVEEGPVETSAFTPTEQTPVTLPAGPTPSLDVDGDEPIAAVAAAVGPALVYIQTQQGLGSGFIYDASGLILTNAHVVGDARTVQVRLADGTSLSGDVLGTDPATDVAVVRIDSAEELPVVRLATGDPDVGQTAVALGSPFGLEQTVTAGIVSAIDRAVPNDSGVAVNMIQTDAPINPGNSGGPLANRSGEVMGISTAIFSQTGENSGIGFATPIDVAKRVADQLVAGDPVERAQLGVQSAGQSGSQTGTVIASLVAGGAAERAGLQVGDRITAVDGDPIISMADLSGQIGSHEPGDVVTVELVRDGRELSVEVTLGAA